MKMRIHRQGGRRRRFETVEDVRREEVVNVGPCVE
jgi:hypothetical protein